MALLARVAAGGVRPRVRRPERWPLPTSIHSYHFDGLGSVIALTNSSGSVVNLYEYSVYGEVSASDPNHPNRFLFTGREFDKDTGLYYYRARYYNPYIGRFLQTDPADEGKNAYTYCSNNAVNRIDPLGLLLEFYAYYAEEARSYAVRNTDPIGYDGYHNAYYGQNNAYNCVPTALANLYIASGEGAVDQVVRKMRDRYGALLAVFTDETVAGGFMQGYFQDYLEVKTVPGVTWETNNPFNYPDRPMDKDWNASGVDGLSYVADIINEVGGIGPYHFVDNAHRFYRAIKYAVKDKGKPVIVGFRLNNAGVDYGVNYHAVVVRYQEDAESFIDGKWVSTPYEIIDGSWGIYEQLYFTPSRFMQLVEGLAGQAVLPSGR